MFQRRRIVNRILAAIAFLSLTVTSARCEEIEEFDLDPPTYAGGDYRDWEGLKKDTWYFAGYQWVTIGILYLAPESVTSWTDEQKEGYDMSYWWDNVTHVSMDTDKPYLNYLLHPYWGAAYFVRARERGYGAKQAFWYSVLLSSMFEFGAEALFEDPSVQDLVVTPVFGSLLGRYFMNARDNVRARELEFGGRTTRDKWVWVLTDPLGALNRQVDKLFGRETQLQVRPYRYVAVSGNRMDQTGVTTENEIVYGLEFRMQW